MIGLNNQTRFFSYTMFGFSSTEISILNFLQKQSIILSCQKYLHRNFSGPKELKGTEMCDSSRKSNVFFSKTTCCSSCTKVSVAFFLLIDSYSFDNFCFLLFAIVMRDRNCRQTCVSKLSDCLSSSIGHSISFYC